MKNIIKEKELDRGYKVILVQTQVESVGDFDKYDIVLNKYNYEIVTLSTGCIGLQSGEYWMDSAIQQMQRVLLLVEDRDMAYHNMMCYSNTYAMNNAKDGYEDKWKYEKEKASMIEKWLLDMSNYWGKESKIGEAIRHEFDIHEIFAE